MLGSLSIRRKGFIKSYLRNKLVICKFEYIITDLKTFPNWRDGRVVEGAALEMLCRGNSTVGSNPTLSAIFYNFMKYYVYILYSKSLGKYYTGISKFSSKRLRQHNSGRTEWSSRADDWKKVFQLVCENSNTARVLEKKIKSRGARRFLEGYSSADSLFVF